jgi:hypothetical protein
VEVVGSNPAVPTIFNDLQEGRLSAHANSYRQRRG